MEITVWLQKYTIVLELQNFSFFPESPLRNLLPKSQWSTAGGRNSPLWRINNFILPFRKKSSDSTLDDYRFCAWRVFHCSLSLCSVIRSTPNWFVGGNKSYVFFPALVGPKKKNPRNHKYFWEFQMQFEKNKKVLPF